MKLIELILHNVGAYAGRQVIDLRTADGAPVVLVGGLNGCGKTTFLDSLQLVLYGARGQLSNRGSRSYEGYLRSLINNEARPEDGASISLTFEIPDEGNVRQYQVVRGWSQQGEKAKEGLDIFVDGQWDKVLSQHWADHIEDLVPVELATLFFFDGEKIESLADPDRASAVVKTAIYSLLGISTLERLGSDLTVLQRRQLADEPKSELADQVDQLERECLQIRNRLDIELQRRAEIFQQSAAAVRSLDIAERKFAAEGGVLFEQHNVLTLERTAVSSRISVAQAELRTMAEGALPLLLCHKAFAAVLDQARGEVAARRSQILAGILEERDRKLLRILQGENRTEVETFLETDRAQRKVLANVEIVLSTVEDDVTAMIATQMHLEGEAQAAGQRLGDLQDLEEQLVALERQIAGVPSEQSIDALRTERDDAQRISLQFSGRLDEIDLSIELVRKELSDREMQLSKVQAQQIEMAVASADSKRIIEHAGRVRQTLQSLRERLIEKNLAKIETATLDSFTRLTRKEGLVSDLRIDRSSYEISLTSKRGDILDPSQLSAGERQLLAVALLWGLARVAGNALPTIVDTPLGRLDSFHRALLVDRYFPNAGNQVILLSTDEEIDETLFNKLRPFISQMYLLEQDPGSDATRVTDGYWWTAKENHVA